MSESEGILSLAAEREARTELSEELMRARIEEFLSR